MVLHFYYVVGFLMEACPHMLGKGVNMCGLLTVCMLIGASSGVINFK